MSDFAIRRFQWIRSPSAWERSQAWRARQQEIRDNFEAANSSANSSFFAATMTLVAGTGLIVAQTASRRDQAQALQAVLNKLA
jgi:hypothetical protein